MRIFFDMDGVQAKWTPVEYEEQLYEKGFYRGLEPNKTVIEAINKLTDNNYMPYTLSKYFEDSKFALIEKIEWANENTPKLDNEHLIWVKYSENKSDYIPDGIQKDDFLIDDYSPNLFEFEEAGGQAIKLMNGVNGTKGTWKGKSVSIDSKTLYEDIIACIKDGLIHTQTMKIGDSNYVKYESSYIENQKNYNGYMKLKGNRTEEDVRRMLNNPDINIKKIDTTHMSYLFDKILRDMISSNFEGRYYVKAADIENNIKTINKTFPEIQPVILRQCFSHDINMFLEKTDYVRVEKDKDISIDPDILTIFENNRREKNLEKGKKEEIEFFLSGDKRHKENCLNYYFPKEIEIQKEKELVQHEK